MRKGIIPAAILLCAGATLSAFAGGGAADHEKKSSRGQEAAIVAGDHSLHPPKESADRKSGPMILKGKITDEEGNPLEGVEVVVERSVPRVGFVESKSERQTSVESGEFEIHLASCGSARVWFRKAGYSFLFVDVRYGSKGPRDDDPYTKVVFEGGTKVVEDMIIALRSEKNATRLRSFGPYLRIRPNGDRVVFDLNNPSHRGNVEVNRARGAKLVKAGGVNTSGTLYAELVPSSLRQVPLVKGGENLWPPRRDVMVVLNGGPDDGFLKATPKRDKRFGKKPALWYMRTAPLGPYSKQLRVTQDELEKFRRGGYVEFYFRMSGKFGKGRLRVGYSESEGVTVTTEFYYQPDGSRNVETKR